MNFKTAKAVISYLYALPRIHRKSDLSYIKRVLAVMGHPERQVKTVHVTGTNGKGSTSYYISELLQKAGQKTGLFVSPYIKEFNERIQLNGHNISDEELIQAANKVTAAVEQIQKTDPEFNLVIFEYETAMAFYFFKKMRCDYAVIEVGIGGTHDKTNVIVPEVSVITTISLDHEKIIGPGLSDIAKEKSGIIKSERPVVLGKIPQAVRPIVLDRAKAMNSPVFELTEAFKASVTDHFSIAEVGGIRYRFKQRPLVETYDMAIAVQVLNLLGLTLAPAVVEKTINSTKIPGRYQILQKRPMIILDGAHNQQAISDLLAYVHQQQKVRGGQVRVLIGMMKDKDIKQVFDLFKPSDQITLTQIDYPRAAGQEDFPPAYPFMANPEAAFRHLQAISQDEDILLVTGSFYLVSQILQMEES